MKENELLDYFRSLADKDGKLDIPTFKHVLKQLGVNHEEGVINETIQEIQSMCVFCLLSIFCLQLFPQLSLRHSTFLFVKLKLKSNNLNSSRDNTNNTP